MEPFNWSAVVKALVESGLTQPQIAEACACGQSTISDILNRRTLDPRVSLAMRLLGLMRQRGVQVEGVDDQLWRALVDMASPANTQEARDAA